MATKIFVNLPVKDLRRSMNFFSALGYKFNPQFTDANAASMVISEDIYVMLLVEEFFKGFTKKEIPDPANGHQFILCLSADSREEVDEMVNKAVAAGATAAADKQDHEGFMYGWGFSDLDGHAWELVWMNPAAIEQKEPVSAEAIA